MMYHKTQQGFSLLLAIIISSVVLAIGLSLLNITMKQLDLSSTARDSEIAFQAAVAGMECAQAIRWKYGSEILRGDTISRAGCGDEEFDLTDTSAAGARNRQEYKVRFDWEPVAEPKRCIDIQLYLINQDAGNRDITAFGIGDFSDRGISRNCPAGVNCTVAIVQGYSTDCDTIDNENAFPVQRELTAEF